MIADETVVVEGLRPTVQAFNRLDRRLGAELRRELLKVAKGAAELASQIAVYNGLFSDEERPGKRGHLADLIRPAAMAKGAVIRELATQASVHYGTRGGRYPNPFPYPAIYEFGGRGDDPEGTGPRAFLAPAARIYSPKAEAMMQEMLGRLTSEAGFGLGGTL